MARTCIFCGRSGPFTKEHVLPEWSARLAGVRRVKVSRTVMDGPPTPMGQRVGTFGQTVKNVCARCNNDWMSDLEGLAIPILSRLIKPAGRTTLTSDEQVVLASWLWKLSIVHESQVGAVYFSNRERHLLRRGDGPPEEHVRMWVALLGRGLDANIRGGPCTFSSPQGDQIPGFIMSMSLRRLAAQVLAVRPFRNINIRTTAQYDFADGEVQVWPPTGHDVEWPPDLAIDQDGFEQWHRRWNTPRRQ